MVSILVGCWGWGWGGGILCIYSFTCFRAYVNCKIYTGEQISLVAKGPNCYPIEDNQEVHLEKPLKGKMKAKVNLFYIYFKL